jgi:hypothetical protein
MRVHDNIAAFSERAGDSGGRADVFGAVLDTALERDGLTRHLDK